MKNQEYKTGDVNGHVIGAGASGIAAKEIHGNVIQVIIRSEEAAQQLGKINDLPTEVKHTQAAGLKGNILPKDTRQLQDNISELLEVIHSSNRQGYHVNEVHAGEYHLSQVGLLIKKAILLKSDADQMYIEQMDKQTCEDSFSAVRDYGYAGLDMDRILSDFDEEAYMQKLREAYELLEEALELDPVNTEVLLHMAQLLIELTPDDPSDEQKLLYRVQNLLINPRTDTELFRLAQATFLLATTGNRLHEGMLNDAREMFIRLRRGEWVRQCNDLIKKKRKKKNEESTREDFEPAGQWNVCVSDFVGSTMDLTIKPSGYFQASQKAGMYEATALATGHWAYVRAQRMLQLRGMVNGFQPFMLGIIIQNQQGNVFYGVGTDGYSYTFQKA